MRTRGTRGALAALLVAAAVLAGAARTSPAAGRVPISPESARYMAKEIRVALASERHALHVWKSNPSHARSYLSISENALTNALKVSHGVDTAGADTQVEDALASDKHAGTAHGESAIVKAIVHKQNALEDLSSFMNAVSGFSVSITWSSGPLDSTGHAKLCWAISTQPPQAKHPYSLGFDQPGGTSTSFIQDLDAHGKATGSHAFTDGEVDWVLNMKGAEIPAGSHHVAEGNFEMGQPFQFPGAPPCA